MDKYHQKTRTCSFITLFFSLKKCMIINRCSRKQEALSIITSKIQKQRCIINYKTVFRGKRRCFSQTNQLHTHFFFFFVWNINTTNASKIKTMKNEFSEEKNCFPDMFLKGPPKNNISQSAPSKKLPHQVCFIFFSLKRVSITKNLPKISIISSLGKLQSPSPF